MKLYQKKMLAVIMVLIMAFAAIGCTGDSSKPSSEDTGKTAGKGNDAPVVFTFANSADLYSMNIGAADSSAEPLCFHAMYDWLIKQEADGTLTPRLITDWSISEDNLACTFTLREGVSFHNGEPWNSQAIKTTLEWLATDNTLSLHTFWAKIDNVEIIDDLHCTVNFKTVDSQFLSNIAGLNGYVAPKAFEELGADKYFEHPYGCGMYSFVSFDPAREFVVERDPNYNYWDKDAKTNVDRIVLKSISEDITRVSALQTGEIQMAFHLPYEQVDTVRNTEGLKLIQEEGPIFYWLGVECGEGYIFNDINLRRALSAAIDRNSIAKNIFGNGRAVDEYLPSFTNVYDAQYSGQYYQYDLEEAKRLIAESNYDGTPIRLIAVNSFARITEHAQAITSMLEAAGFNVDLQMIEHSALNDLRGAGKYDVFISAHSATADSTLALDVQVVQDRGHFELNNQEVIEVIKQATRTVDNEARKKLLQQAGKMLADLCAPQIPLYTIDTCIGVAESVSGYAFTPALLYLDTLNMIIEE